MPSAKTRKIKICPKQVENGVRIATSKRPTQEIGCKASSDRNTATVNLIHPHVGHLESKTLKSIFELVTRHMQQESSEMVVSAGVVASVQDSRDNRRQPSVEGHHAMEISGCGRPCPTHELA